MLRSSACATAIAARASSASSGPAEDGKVKRRKRPRTNGEWNALSEEDFERFDAEWRDGDDPEELMERRQLEAIEMDKAQRLAAKAAESMDSNDERARHLGPTMLFVNMVKSPSEALEDLVEQWKELLSYGGTHVTGYIMDVQTVLLTLQRGWEAPDVKKFLLERPEVRSITWDDKEYFPNGEDRAAHSNIKRVARSPAPGNPPRKRSKRRRKRSGDSSERTRVDL